MNYLYRIFRVLNFKEKKYLFYSFLTILITSTLETIGLGLLYPILNSILDPESLNKLSFLIFIKKYFNFNFESIYILLIFLSLFLILKNIIIIFFNWYNLTFSGYLKSRFISDLLRIYLNKNYSFFIENSNARIMRDIQNAEKFQSLILNLINIFSDILLIIFLFCLIFYIKAIIIIPILFLIFLSVILSFIFKKYLIVKGKTKYNLALEVNKWLLESLNAIKEIKILNKESFFYKNFKKLFYKVNYIERTSSVMQIMPKYLIEIFIIFSFLLIFIYTKLQLTTPQEFIVTLGFVLLVILRITPPIVRIMPALQVVSFFKNEVSDFLSDYEDLSNKYQNINKYLKSNLNYSQNINNKNLIFFENVTFKYHDNDSLIFHKLNFTADANKIIGITGPSGIGKSTFLDLFLGLLFPYEGNVYSNGKNIHEDIITWRDRIGYVCQNPYILNDNIINNVAFGTKESEINMKAVEDALTRSLLINNNDKNLLKKYATDNLGENSRKLSGGQKQRLAIARVFYRNPQIVILDEATNALDEKNENELYKILKDNRKDKLIIIVSHKISNFKLCDDLYAIDNFNLKKI
jgi:ABC-type bacteriocin/lantibiotic exporter with double-glycine peptidase domain